MKMLPETKKDCWNLDCKNCFYDDDTDDKCEVIFKE